MALLDFKGDGVTVDYTPASAVSAGQPVRLPDGRIGVAVTDIAANALGAARVSGVFEGAAASAATWSKGDKLVWDESENTLVKAALTLDGDADKVLGTAWAVKINGQTTARVQLQDGARNLGPQIHAVSYEFDCQTGIDADTHVLIPAEQNPHGLLLIGAYGIVTEVMAGSSEDQGRVTIEDSDGTDLSTLTASDAAADATGDIIVGTLSAAHATTGAAAPVVAAGKAVRGVVSQATSGGSPAGKIKVVLLLVPLL